ncbi:hypothetical protein AAG570_010877 [Ranatra chinensis]|uniref:Uncharacterized protein n=1 Tax=Ranatra chinensis TaxID=642074 RepID=A0ABD0YJA7_9HEMI
MSSQPRTFAPPTPMRVRSVIELLGLLRRRCVMSRQRVDKLVRSFKGRTDTRTEDYGKCLTLFTKPKESLGGKRFSNNEEAEETWLSEVERSVFDEDIRRLGCELEKCIEVDDECVEINTCFWTYPAKKAPGGVPEELLERRMRVILAICSDLRCRFCGGFGGSGRGLWRPRPERLGQPAARPPERRPQSRRSLPRARFVRVSSRCYFYDNFRNNFFLLPFVFRCESPRVVRMASNAHLSHGQTPISKIKKEPPDYEMKRVVTFLPGYRSYFLDHSTVIAEVQSGDASSHVWLASLRRVQPVDAPN